MHDPKVVAFDIPRPWPQRSGMPPRKNAPRWQFRFAHVSRWRFWTGWMKFWRIAGREIYWTPLITVWHQEPGGLDALTVCRRRVHGRNGWTYLGRWQWHVHHWRVQIHPLQKLHRTLFERCEGCGRRYPWGYAPVAHQWDQPRGRWWRVTRRAFHHECSSLDGLQRVYEYRGQIIRSLIAELRVRTDESEVQIVERLTGHESPLAIAIATGETFPLRNHLQRLMGYERDDDYRLVKKEVQS